VLPFPQVVSANGEDHLERIEVRVQAPNDMEKTHSFEADALFVIIGADANTSWLPSELERDLRGYIVRLRRMRSQKRCSSLHQMTALCNWH
jgi:thioredoxin reductase (NADPH)